MDKLLGQPRGAVEFWDFARVNSLRTLPYLQAWHARYGEHGPARDRRALARLLVRARAARTWSAPSSGSAIQYPVAARPRPRGLARLRQHGLAGPLPVRPARAGCATSTTARATTWTPSWPSRSCCSRSTRTSPCPSRSTRCAPRTSRASSSSRRPPTSRCRPTASALELVRDWVDGPDYIEAADAGAGAAVRSFRAGGAFAVLSGGGRARALRGRRRRWRRVARAAAPRLPVHAAAAGG